MPVPGPTTPAAGDVGDGCGDAAVTDPTDLDIGREVARCASGSPEPVPLPQPATVRVALADPTLGATPLLVAAAEGEFEEENLTVEIVPLPQPEAYAAMARGEIDAVVGTVDGPFLDAVESGTPARLALGGPLSRAPGDLEVPQAGLWARVEVLPDPDEWDSVEGQKRGGERWPRRRRAVPDRARARPGVAVAQLGRLRAGVVGRRRPAPAGRRRQHGLAPRARGRRRRRGRRLHAARHAAGQRGHRRHGARAPACSAPTGPSGVAFLRALIRSVNTYLADGWSDEAAAALADATGESERTVRAGPDPLFDWEVRSDTTTRIQEALVAVGGIGYERPLADDALVDRSLYEEAVGGADGAPSG